jgi:hypothetical protein
VKSQSPIVDRVKSTTVPQIAPNLCYSSLPAEATPGSVRLEAKKTTRIIQEAVLTKDNAIIISEQLNLQANIFIRISERGAEDQ